MLMAAFDAGLLLDVAQNFEVPLHRLGSRRLRSLRGRRPGETSSVPVLQPSSKQIWGYITKGIQIIKPGLWPI